MGSNNNPGNDKNAGDQGSGRVQENRVEQNNADKKMSDQSFDLRKERSPEAKGSNTADKSLPGIELEMNGNKKDAGDGREESQVAHAGDRGGERGGEQSSEGDRGGKRRHLERGRTSAEVSEDGNEVSSRVGDTEVRHNRRDRSSEIQRGDDRIGLHGDCDRDELRRRSERSENEGQIQANEDGDTVVSDQNTTVEQHGDDVTFYDRHRGRHHGRHHGDGDRDGDRDRKDPEAPPETQTQDPATKPETVASPPDSTANPEIATNPETGDQTNERGDGDGHRRRERDMGDFTLRRGEDRHGPRHLIVGGEDLGALDANTSTETLAKAGLTRVDENTYRMQNGQTFDISERGKIEFTSRDNHGNENHIEMGESDPSGQPIAKQDGIKISHIPGGGTQVTEPDGNVYTQKDGQFESHNSEGDPLQAFNYDTGDFTGLDLSFDLDDATYSLGGGFSDGPLFGEAGYDASTVYGQEEKAPDKPAEQAGEATSATQAGTAAVINITNLSGTVSPADIAQAFGAAGNCLTVGNQLYAEYLQTGSEQARALFGDLMAMHAQVVSKTADAQPMAVQNQVLDRFGIRGSLMGEVGTDVAQRFSNTNPYKVAQWLSEEVKRGGMIDSSRLANIA